ncbi:MAG: hypothetical protein COA59_06005 [Colwellia sp.]|jgi:hypothetical protein|nr:MAG: hypothetical protein COA59_06005 [Colwellia sp.]
MLIKINESDAEFVAFVEELKQHYGSATAAGAIKKAILNHVSVIKDLRKNKKIRYRLEGNLAEIKDIRRQQKSLEQALSIMID